MRASNAWRKRWTWESMGICRGGSRPRRPSRSRSRWGKAMPLLYQGSCSSSAPRLVTTSVASVGRPFDLDLRSWAADGPARASSSRSRAAVPGARCASAAGGGAAAAAAAAGAAAAGGAAAAEDDITLVPAAAARRSAQASAAIARRGRRRGRGRMRRALGGDQRGLRSL